MKKVYNLSSNQISTQHASYTLSEHDVVLYEEFKKAILTSEDYSTAHRNMLNHVLDKRVMLHGNEDTQLLVNQLSLLKQVHFQVNRDKINIQSLKYELNQAIEHPPLLTIDTISSHIIKYLSRVINSMSELEFRNLVDLSMKFKELVLFTLQPLFINLLGITEFVKHLPYFISEDNFTRLLIHCKSHTPTLNLIDVFNNFYTSIPIKTIATLIVTPLFCYSLYNMIKIETPKQSTSFTVPKINRPGFNSEYFKLLGDFIYKLGGEIGSLLSQMPAGMTVGGMSTMQDRVERALGGSSATVSVDRDKNSISFSSSQK